MKKLKIKTSTPYYIHFDVDLLKDINTILAKFKISSIVLISDDKLTKSSNDIINSLQHNYKISSINLKVSEEIKNMDSANFVMNEILKTKIDKNTILIALGGGVIGDLVGFCASILLRGIGYIHIPSTLLAMVDSSIGGKCGVNTIHGKNLIGSVYQPLCVLMDYNLLNGLNNNDYLSGYGEVIKYALAFDIKFFKYLDSNIDKLHGKNKDYLANIIEKSCKFKKSIVEKDEFEKKSIRVLLNLGHSFAHAIETYNNYNQNILHGEAVALGCILAFKFSHFIGLYKGDIPYLEKFINHIKKAHLPISLKNIIINIEVSKLVEYMINDKKNTHQQINLILPIKFGKCGFIKNVDKNKITQFLTKELT
jgi:3-dehydroquinate synthase